MKHLKTIAFGGALLVLCSAMGQTWNSLPGGNLITNNEWLGADVGSTIPLSLETRVNQPMLFRTNSAPRLRISETIINATHNGYINLNLTGHLGIGAGIVPQPLAFLHINNSSSQLTGYRPWMRTGVIMSEQTDWMYVGTMPNGVDRIDAAINWGDNNELNPIFGPDALRFIFTRNPNNMLNQVASGLNGLEIARLRPAANGNEGFFGIGDFFTGAVNPSERLHVLNGRVRFQQLPDDAEAPVPITPAITKVLVVDDTPAPSGERGVIKWRDLDGLNTDCDWTRDATTNFDVCTAYLGNSCPPDETRRVGIGVEDPKAKLHVYTTTPSSLFGGNVTLSILQSDEEGGRAITGEARSQYSSSFNGSNFFGCHGLATNVRFGFGVRGYAGNTCDSPGQASLLVGVYGEVRACDNADLAIGVYGRAGGASLGQDYAAWFDGIGYISSGIWVPSDATLKQNITDVEPEDAVQRFMSLEPKSYEFNTSAHPEWKLPEGYQLGFLAQDLAQSYPHLVKDVIHPPILDTAGIIIAEAEPLTVVNMDGLIPEMVVVVQEQQRRLEEQNDRIAALEEMVAACCAANHGTRAPSGAISAGSTLENDLRVAPNPVADRTELRYTVAAAGRVRLEITDASSRVVLSREEGQRTSGSYMYEWDTTLLSPGTYICTLYINDEFLVKKSVKLGTR